MSESHPLPPLPRTLSLPKVQVALRRTTEFFAHELATPGATAPQWSETEWTVARAVVTIHGVSGLLAKHLRWPGPKHWLPYLRGQREQIKLRATNIRELVRQVDAAGRQRGLAFVALKGAALHARGLYVPGERPMGDLDLLVREADAARAGELLENLGFRAAGVTWKHHTFEPVAGERAIAPFGENAANPLKIELHTHIREIFPLRPVDISELIFAKHPQPGVNDYPSAAALLLHLLHHAAGTLTLRSLRLLHLADLARLAQRMTEADWENVLALGATTADGNLWWAFAPLMLLQRYFSCVPEPVLDQVARHARWLLRSTYRRRRLADVSLSNLWISAFPGIVWAQSPREMAAYALQRVRPTRETLALRQEFAASQPLVSGGEWATTSQGRRIVRWLFARQPRQETLQPLLASFALSSGAAS